MKSKHYLILFVILILGLALRLYKIDNPVADWHSWRQADTASVARLYVENGIDLLRPKYHDISNIASGLDNPEGWRFVEFPIYNAIHALLYKAYPNLGFDKWGRLTSVIISLGSLLFVYLLGKRFISRAGGLLAAFFFAALPFNIYFSRVILPEPLTVFFIVSSLYFFSEYIEKEKKWSIYLSGVLFAMALLIKPYIVFYGAAFLYLAWEKYKIRGSLKNFDFWVFLSLVASPFFFWRGWMWSGEHIRGIPHWKWAFNGDNIRFRPAFWWWILEERLGRMILGVWAVLPFSLGFLNIKKSTHDGTANYPFFLHILFTSQFTFMLTVATASVRHDYYQTLTIPAVSLALASGFLFLWNTKVFNTQLARLTAVGTIAMGLFFSFYQIKEFYKINHPEIILAGNRADEILPKDSIVIAPYNGDTAFLYQTKRRGFPYIVYPLPEMIERHSAQYYISVNFDNQTKQVMEQYIVLDKTDKYVIIDLTRKK